MNNEIVDPDDRVLDSLDPAGREVEDEDNGFDDPCFDDGCGDY